MVTMDELKQLAMVASDYLCDGGSYIELMDGITSEFTDPEEALVEFFSYFIPAPQDEIEQAIKLFLEIPFEQMPLYVIPKAPELLKKASCLCPPASEGPYPWQVILARWRAKIRK